MNDVPGPIRSNLAYLFGGLVIFGLITLISSLWYFSAPNTSKIPGGYLASGVPISTPSAITETPAPTPPNNYALLNQAKSYMVNPMSDYDAAEAQKRLKAIPRGASEYTEAQDLLKRARRKQGFESASPPATAVATPYDNGPLERALYARRYQDNVKPTKSGSFKITAQGPGLADLVIRHPSMSVELAEAAFYDPDLHAVWLSHGFRRVVFENSRGGRIIHDLR